MRCCLGPDSSLRSPVGAEAGYGPRSMAGQYGRGPGGEGVWALTDVAAQQTRQCTGALLRQYPRLTIVRMAQTTEEKKPSMKKINTLSLFCPAISVCRAHILYA